MTSAENNALREQARDAVWDTIAEKCGEPEEEDRRLFEERLTHLTNATTLFGSAKELGYGTVIPRSVVDRLWPSDTGNLGIPKERLGTMTIKEVLLAVGSEAVLLNSKMTNEWRWKGSFDGHDLQFLTSMKRPIDGSTLTPEFIASIAEGKKTQHQEMCQEFNELVQELTTVTAPSDSTARHQELVTELTKSKAYLTELAELYAMCEAHAKATEGKGSSQSDAGSFYLEEPGIVISW